MLLLTHHIIVEDNKGWMKSDPGVSLQVEKLVFTDPESHTSPLHSLWSPLHFIHWGMEEKPSHGCLGTWILILTRPLQRLSHGEQSLKSADGFPAGRKSGLILHFLRSLHASVRGLCQGFCWPCRVPTNREEGRESKPVRVPSALLWAFLQA